MNILRRGGTIVISPQNESGKYEVYDDTGNLIMDSSRKFNIYFTNVEFRDDSYVTATYLGETTGGLADEYSRTISFTRLNGWVTEDGKQPKTARMASLENGVGMVIINK